MKKIFSLIFIVFIISLYSQTQIDSLITQLKHSNNLEKIQILNELSYQLRKSDKKKSLEYALEALQLSRKINHKKNECISLKNIGNYYTLSRDYEKATEYYNLGLKISKKKHFYKSQADFLYNLAMIEKNNHNFEIALKHYYESLILYEKTKNTEKIANTLFSIGTTYWYKGDYSKALEYQKKSLKCYQELKNNRKIAKTYNNMGNLYYKLGDFNKSIDMYMQSLKIKEDMGDKKEIAFCLSNIGNIYIKTGNFQKALETHLYALQVYEDMEDKELIVITLNSIGVDYSELGNKDEAIIYFEKVLRFSDDKSVQKAVGFALNNIGRIFMNRGNNQEAQNYFEKSILVKKAINDKSGLAISYKNLSYIHIYEKRNNKAKELLIKSMEMAKEIDDLYLLKECYGALADLYFGIGSYKLAFENLTEYSVLLDSLVSESTNERINELLIQYETEKKGKEIEILKQESVVKEFKIKEQKLIKNIFILGLILFIIISYIIYKIKQREIKTQKRVEIEIIKLNKELEDRVQKELAKQKKQQQFLIQKSKLESLGKLAAGIAHEINQPLGGISMGMENLYFYFEEDQADKKYLQSKLQTIKGYIERISQIINHIRIFSRNQKSIIYEKIYVNEVVRNALSMINTQYKKHNVQIELNLEEDIGYVTGNKFKLEQVIVNLLSNAKDALEEKVSAIDNKSYSKIITIKSYSKDDKIIIEIEDNGMGVEEDIIDNIFDPFFTTKDPEKGTGLGLSIIYGIINEMQGEITIESDVGKFTKMIVTLPKV
ncbi:MAG: tetratricopeptide repeat protein [Candidatus Cloacimonetes bacterium]|nr:tetratricopeptide repeat protein [Candidatus Cloacimonadota bacterium]